MGNNFDNNGSGSYNNDLVTSAAAAVMVKTKVRMTAMAAMVAVMAGMVARTMVVTVVAMAICSGGQGNGEGWWLR